MGEDKPGKSEDGSSTEQSAGSKVHGGERGESGGDGGEVGDGGLENGVGDERGGRGAGIIDEEYEEGEEERDGIAEESGCDEAQETPAGENEPRGVPVVGPGEEAGSTGGNGEQRCEPDEGVDDDEGNVEDHIQLFMSHSLMTLALTAHIFYSLLGAAANAVVRPFDASGGGVGQRWDVVHFADIAAHGYRWEHEFAFLPGAPLVVKYLSPLSINVMNGGLGHSADAVVAVPGAHWHRGRTPRDGVVAGAVERGDAARSDGVCRATVPLAVVPGDAVLCTTTMAAGDAVFCARNSAQVQRRLSRRICGLGILPPQSSASLCGVGCYCPPVSRPQLRGLP